MAQSEGADHGLLKVNQENEAKTLSNTKEAVTEMDESLCFEYPNVEFTGENVSVHISFVIIFVEFSREI